MVELVQVVLAREDGPIGEHLSQNAAHRPDVDGLGVALGKGKVVGCPQQGPVVWAKYQAEGRVQRPGGTTMLLPEAKAQRVCVLCHGGQGPVPGSEMAPGLPFTGGELSYLGVQHDLWSPVPARRHVLRQKASVVMFRISNPGQAKIADLESNSGY